MAGRVFLYGDYINGRGNGRGELLVFCDSFYNFIADHDGKVRPRSVFSWSVMRVLTQVVAIYMSFRRNGGFNFLSFVVAILFAPLYLIYAVAVPIKDMKSKTRKLR